MTKEFIIGSWAFFDVMPMFYSGNKDILIFTDNPDGFSQYRESHISGLHRTIWVIKPKEELIQYALRDSANGLEFGKFITPEVIEYLGLTIEDLGRLYEKFKDKIEEYQRVIYDAYVSNGSFTLTEEQRSAAYEAYKDARPEQYKIEDYKENE